MKLRILVFLVLAGLCFGQSYGQKNCKFEYENEDPFTGDITLGTSTTIFPISISTNEFWHIGINRENDHYNIVNDLQLGGQWTDIISVGDSIMLKTADGDVITCHATETVNPRPKANKVLGKTILNTQYICLYELNKEQLQLLAKSAITYIRLNIGTEVFEQSIKSKHGKDFMKSAGCVLNY